MSTYSTPPQVTPGPSWPYAAPPGPPKPSRGRALAMAVVAVVAMLLLGVVGLRLLGVNLGVTAFVIDDNARSKGLPEGYESYHLPELGRTYTVGQPWGQPCQPVVIVLRGAVTPALVHESRTVVKEARKAELPVSLATDATLQRKLGTAAEQPGRFDLVAQNGPAPANSRGEPSRYLITGTYQHNSDNGDNLEDGATVYLFTDSVGSDRGLMRRVVRHVVAAVAGLDPSATAPGSGLTQHLEESIDGFSDTDVEAMLTMSGCAG